MCIRDRPESVFDLSNCQILGVDGRKLVCYEYEYNAPENVQKPEISEGATQEEIDQLYMEYQSRIIGTHRVYLHDIDTGAEQDLDNWTSTMGNEGRLVTWQDGNLYWCENGWNQLPDSMHWMAADGEEHELSLIHIFGCPDCGCSAGSAEKNRSSGTPDRYPWR